MLFLNVIVFAVLALWAFYKYKVNISFYLLLLYLLAAVSAVLVDVFYKEEIIHPERITIDSNLYQITIILLFVLPIIKFGNSINVESLKYKSLRKLNTYS